MGFTWRHVIFVDGVLKTWQILGLYLQVECAAIYRACVRELQALLHGTWSHQLAESDDGLAFGLHVADALESGMVQFSARREGLATGTPAANFLFCTY